MNFWLGDLDASAIAYISIKSVGLNDGNPATARLTNGRLARIQRMTAENLFAQSTDGG
jgi:hypothetical protein